ncbi:hypothetical protein HK102_010233 [Quaeritorhiza haematococci]|nr:hypothetical protein HK102_010233 [Quaeritorhiza haematococci]
MFFPGQPAAFSYELDIIKNKELKYNKALQTSIEKLEAATTAEILMREELNVVKKAFVALHEASTEMLEGLYKNILVAPFERDLIISKNYSDNYRTFVETVEKAMSISGILNLKLMGILDDLLRPFKRFFEHRHELYLIIRRGQGLKVAEYDLLKKLSDLCQKILRTVDITEEDSFLELVTLEKKLDTSKCPQLLDANAEVPSAFNNLSHLTLWLTKSVEVPQHALPTCPQRLCSQFFQMCKCSAKLIGKENIGKDKKGVFLTLLSDSLIITDACGSKPAKHSKSSTNVVWENSFVLTWPLTSINEIEVLEGNSSSRTNAMINTLLRTNPYSPRNSPDSTPKKSSLKFDHGSANGIQCNIRRNEIALSLDGRTPRTYGKDLPENQLPQPPIKASTSDPVQLFKGECQPFIWKSMTNEHDAEWAKLPKCNFLVHVDDARSWISLESVQSMRLILNSPINPAFECGNLPNDRTQKYLIMVCFKSPAPTKLKPATPGGVSHPNTTKGASDTRMDKGKYLIRFRDTVTRDKVKAVLEEQIARTTNQLARSLRSQLLLADQSDDHPNQKILREFQGQDKPHTPVTVVTPSTPKFVSKPTIASERFGCRVWHRMYKDALVAKVEVDYEGNTTENISVDNQSIDTQSEKQIKASGWTNLGSVRVYLITPDWDPRPYCFWPSASVSPRSVVSSNSASRDLNQGQRVLYGPRPTSLVMVSELDKKKYIEWINVDLSARTTRVEMENDNLVRLLFFVDGCYYEYKIFVYQKAAGEELVRQLNDAANMSSLTQQMLDRFAEKHGLWPEDVDGSAETLVAGVNNANWRDRSLIKQADETTNPFEVDAPESAENVQGCPPFPATKSSADDELSLLFNKMSASESTSTTNQNLKTSQPPSIPAIPSVDLDVPTPNADYEKTMSLSRIKELFAAVKQDVPLPELMEKYGDLFAFAHQYQLSDPSAISASSSSSSLSSCGSSGLSASSSTVAGGTNGLNGEMTAVVDQSLQPQPQASSSRSSLSRQGNISPIIALNQIHNQAKISANKLQAAQKKNLERVKEVWKLMTEILDYEKKLTPYRAGGGGAARDGRSQRGNNVV